MDAYTAQRDDEPYVQLLLEDLLGEIDISLHENPVGNRLALLVMQDDRLHSDRLGNHEADQREREVGQIDEGPDDQLQGARDPGDKSLEEVAERSEEDAPPSA